MSADRRHTGAQEARGEVGYLALADGKIFKGKCFGALRGASNPVEGEAVFNTSMYGYQEILTDQIGRAHV